MNLDRRANLKDAILTQCRNNLSLGAASPMGHSIREWSIFLM